LILSPFNINFCYLKKSFSTQLKKLEGTLSTNTQIIATMRHEIDILSSHRTSFKTIEKENEELKSKLELMQIIESVMTASQKEVDEILKQNLSSKDLSVMCGTLRRELNSSECKKQELRKQIQSLKNDIRAQQEENKNILEKMSLYESENHSLLSRVRRLESKREFTNDGEEDKDGLAISPDGIKKPRLALKHMDNQNTPSPLSNNEFQNRIKNIQESDSPYLRVKSSSIALGTVLKKPGMLRSASHQNFPLTNHVKQLSIFKNPRLTEDMQKTNLKAQKDNFVYNGIGGTSKLLQSDLKQVKFDSTKIQQKFDKVNFAHKKKISPNVLLN
jgi:hypothetical protein